MGVYLSLLYIFVPRHFYKEETNIFGLFSRQTSNWQRSPEIIINNIRFRLYYVIGSVRTKLDLCQHEKRNTVSNKGHHHRGAPSGQIRYVAFLWKSFEFQFISAYSSIALTVRYLTRRYIGEYRSHTGKCRDISYEKTLY